MPDGAELSVRIVGDQQFINISGGSCVLPMDSGVVDILTFNDVNPAAYQRGIMLEPSAVQAYNAAFVLPESGGDWLLNPSKNSSAQISGILTASKAGKFKGKLPKDRTFAASFAPQPIIDTTTTPATITYKERDDALLAKKIAAFLCPASVFTGRTRLYIQSLYGRHLYPKQQEVVDVVTFAAVTGSPPYLIIPSFKRPNETPDDSRIYSGSGVHLDRATGKHWLFTVSSTGVIVCLLKGDSCAEGLRKFLKLPYPEGLPVLDEAALRHLEAYILSRCLPDIAGQQVAACSLPMSFYSMGYSWHWNFSGTVADIVVNEQFDQPPAGYAAMESSHYRISMSLTEGVWSASVATLVNKAKWCINRTYNVIAEPDNAKLVLYKTTPRRSLIFNCDAPFYAFYVGDALKLCRVQTSNMDAPDSTYEASPLFVNDVGDTTYLSTKDNSGYRREKSFSAYEQCIITCGDQVTGQLYVAKISNEHKTEMSKVILNERVGPAYGDDDGFQYNRSFPFGEPPYQYAGPFPTTIVNTSYFVTGTSHIDLLDVHEETYSYSTVIVPFRDAEAIYLQSSDTTLTITTGTTQDWQHNSRPAFGYTTRVNEYSGGVFQPTMWFTIYPPLAGGAPSGDSPVYGTVNESVTSGGPKLTCLVCKAGAVPITDFGSLGELHNPEVEEVVAAFSCFSGASITNPVVLADKITPVGISSSALIPAFVGWI